MKNKMFIAGMSLVIALVLLATASFAWFTISTAPEVKGMEVALYTDRTLLLAPGDGTNTAPDSDEFKQYISLADAFAGLAPLRPVSTADGVNWYLPAYSVSGDGSIGQVSNFILDDTLEHGNVSIVDSTGKTLTDGALNDALSRSYYVYTDIWMMTEEPGAKVRLSIPHVYGTPEARHAGTVTEYGLDAEELQQAVYGTYVLGEPELDENDSTALKTRTEEPEKAIRVGFLVYQDPETLDPVSDGITDSGIPGEETSLPFKIYEPNADKRAAGTQEELLLAGTDGSQAAERQSYIAGGAEAAGLQDNTYYVTMPFAKAEDGMPTLTTVSAEDMIVQLSGAWDDVSVVKTLNGQQKNGIKKASSNDVATFGEFLKIDESFTQPGGIVNLSNTDGMTDIAGSNVIVELKQDTPVRVRLFVWLEGQDVDCWNDIAAGSFRINLELAGETVQEDREEPDPGVTVCTMKGYGTDGNSSDGWFDSSAAGITRDEVTEIEFTDRAPQVYTASWNAGEQSGDNAITAYRVDTKLFIAVPDSVEKISLPSDCSSFFAEMTSCEVIYGLEYLDTTKVKNMADMFSHDSGLTFMNLSGFDTSKVTDMGAMFCGCGGLIFLNLSGFDTSAVTTMESMFENCTNLQILNIASFNTSNVANMAHMFAGCEILPEADVSRFDTSKVITMERMFEYCYYLTSLDLSSFNTSNAENMECMFNSDVNLKTVYAGEGWSTAKAAVSSDMFAGCTSLVGGNRTAYDGEHLDKTYARIDAAGTPGYFTDKNAPIAVCRLKSGRDWFDETAAGISKGNVTELVISDTVPGGYSASWDAGQDSNPAPIYAYVNGTVVTLVVPEGEGKIYVSEDATSMFGSMRKLQSIKGIELLDTSLTTNMYYMFGYCTSLTELDLSGFDTSKVTNMGGMFTVCQSLRTLNLSGLDTSSAVQMYNMFYYCQSLTSLDLSGLDLSSAESMDSMFEECTGLTSLDLSGADTSSLQNMYRMFKNCNKLTVLDLGSFDTSKVSNMESMFEGCESLKTIYAGSGWSTGSVVYGSMVFQDCWNIVGGSGTVFSDRKTKHTYARIDGGTDFPGYLTRKPNPPAVLKGYGTDGKSSDGWFDSSAAGIARDEITELEFTVKAPEDQSISWNAGAGTGGEVIDAYLVGTKVYIVVPEGTVKIALPEFSADLFRGLSGCSIITGLGLVDTSRVTDMRSMFGSCNNLTGLDVSGFDTSKVTDMSYMFYGCNILTSLDVRSFDTSKVTDMSYMFSGCRWLTALDLRGFDTSKVTTMRYMFQQCEGLTGLDLSGFDTSAVTDMDHMFWFCISLTGLDVSGFVTSSVTNMSEMFASCVSLTGLDVSGFNTSKVTDMYNMFGSCEGLTGLNVSGFNTSKVTNMGAMFFGCSSLSSLDVSGFDTSAVTDMSYMFHGCAGLTSLNISGLDTSKVTNMNYMFYDCRNLTGLNVSGFDTSKVRDMRSMFGSCRNLTGLDVGSFDTSEVRDMHTMFSGCSKLTSLDLSVFDTSQVTGMAYMFSACTGLKTIYAGTGFTTTPLTSSTNMFQNCTSLVGGNGTVYSKSNTDRTYARIDKAGQPGYFTDIADKPAVVIGTLKGYGTNGNTSDGWFDSTAAGIPRSQITALEFVKRVPTGYTATWNAGTGTGDEAINAYLTGTTVSIVLPAGADKIALPEDSKKLFYNLYYCRAINGLQYVDTSAVTNMSNMFNGCCNLTSLDLSGFDTSKVTTMAYMFNSCEQLTSLDVSGFDTSKVTDMSIMFCACKKLTSLDVSGFDTSQVTDMATMFYGCISLTSLDVSGFDTSKVTNLRSTFNGCSGLTGLDVSGFDTSQVTNMATMFKGCSGLTSLDVSGFDTSQVKAMQSMFDGCSKLTSLDVSGFNTSKVTNMSNMFQDCSNLTSLNVSGFDTSKVTDMSVMFCGCKQLTSLDVSGFDTSQVTTMYGMFYGCSKLTSLDVSGFDTSKVTSMNNTFANCSGLTSLDVSGFNTSKVTYMGYMFNGCSGLTSLDVSGFNTSKVTAMCSMFCNCSKLTSLDVSGFDTSMVTAMQSMFNGCSKLTGLNVSGFGTSKVTLMSDMFRGCSGLTSLDVSGFDTSMVTNMSYMFNGCSGLTGLDVSGFDTSKVTNMAYMFYGCSGLTSLDVSGFDTSMVTNMISMFSCCSGLTGLDVRRFDTSKVITMQGMFYGCSGLTSLDVSSFDTSKVRIMQNMFYGCSGLAAIYAGDGFTTSGVTMDTHMFLGCTALVGGSGTPYNSAHVDKTYARIDGGTAAPGYFTAK